MKTLTIAKRIADDIDKLDFDLPLDEWTQKLNLLELQRNTYSGLLHTEGMTWSEIGKIFGVSPSAVQNWCRYGGEKFPQEIKDKVKIRDNFTCRCCGKKSKKGLHAHHLESRKGHKKDNLITLCAGCHMKLEAVNRNDNEHYKLMVRYFRSELGRRKQLKAV